MRAIFAVGLVLVLFLWVLKRAGRLFSIRIRGGRITSSKGRIPPRMLAEIADVVERAGVTSADISCVLRDRQPVLVFRGEMPTGVAQQLRNVAGQFRAQLGSGRRAG